MKRIKVHLVRKKNLKFIQVQWSDPLTGKRPRISTGTAVVREAERFAARLEDELNEGRRSSYRTTWEDFKTRYRTEVVAFRSAAQGAKVNQAFGHVDEHLEPKFLRTVDAGALSKLSASLLANGLAPATVASVLRTLKAAIRWAAGLELIPKVPKITMPANVAKAGGRPVTGEEFDRLLNEATASDTDTVVVASRVRFLRGLWWSGLRLNEAVRLDWEDDQHICVDLSGERPTFRIRSEADKGRKNRRFPMAPEFAEMLLSVPPSERVGRVLPFLGRGHRPLAMDRVVRAICGFGTAAGIVVGRNTEGEPIYASAHDLRRSFGTRWAKRVLPPVLKLLMRHSSIATTMTYYVDIDTDEATAALYAAIAKEAKDGDKSGDTAEQPKKGRPHKSLS